MVLPPAREATLPLPWSPWCPLPGRLLARPTWLLLLGLGALWGEGLGPAHPLRLILVPFLLIGVQVQPPGERRNSGQGALSSGPGLAGRRTPD